MGGRPEDGRTLNEVWAEADAMLEDAVKNARFYEFYNADQAYRFRQAAIVDALALMGVTYKEPMTEHQMEMLMMKQGVKIETRRYHDDSHHWREGTYIYNTTCVHDELAYYVGNVKIKRSSVARVFDKWGVLTNVTGTAKKFISIPEEAKLMSPAKIEVEHVLPPEVAN